MDTMIFSFEDAVHSHLTIGIVDGCLACAQTTADMALSRERYMAARPTRAFVTAA